MNIEILLTALLVALSTSLVGVFLVLRRLSMIADAISHTVLLGIVLAFLLTRDLNSPLLIVGATLMGVLTVYAIELLIKTRNIKEDASIGVIFTLLFAVSIIIINTLLRDVHLDTHTVLLGNLEFVPFNRMDIFGVSLPAAMVIMGVVLMINIGFISLFYKEVKLVSFDTALAGVLGFAPVIIHYAMMTLVSLTAVAAFDAVGAILVIALMIAPPLSALQFTKTLFSTILLSLIIAVFNTVVGYAMSIILDVTISGSIASIALFTFMVTLIFAPRKGILFQYLDHKRAKENIMIDTLIMHIGNHAGSIDAEDELGEETIHTHMRWSPRMMTTMLEKARAKGLINIENNAIMLSNKGIARFKTFKEE